MRSGGLVLNISVRVSNPVYNRVWKGTRNRGLLPHCPSSSRKWSGRYEQSILSAQLISRDWFTIKITLNSDERPICKFILLYTTIYCKVAKPYVSIRYVANFDDILTTLCQEEIANRQEGHSKSG